MEKICLNSIIGDKSTLTLDLAKFKHLSKNKENKQINYI